MTDERGKIEFTVRPHDGPSLVHWHGGRMERERELMADAKRLKERVAELEDVFGQAEPWPLVDVLARLLDLGEHAQTAHSCDRHGYEEDLEAMKSGYQLLKRLRSTAAKPEAPCPK